MRYRVKKKPWGQSAMPRHPRKTYLQIAKKWHDTKMIQMLTTKKFKIKGIGK